MTEVDINGIGIWSERFADWDDFCRVLAGGEAAGGGSLNPELIAARERRRAPQSVKLAVEVMDQACRMAAIDAADAATVFASGMGDMQLTDYMCTTLMRMPRAVSPTRFHNSVHNAATGYWSIATGSHAPANAISGFDDSAAIALLEGAVQAVEEQVPVIVAIEETAAPEAFRSIYESTQPLGSALLLTAAGSRPAAMAKLRIRLDVGPSPRDAAPLPPALVFPGNYAATLLPLFKLLGEGEAGSLALALGARQHIVVDLAPATRQ